MKDDASFTFKAPCAEPVTVNRWTRLLQLPSGDCVRAEQITSIRTIGEKADAKTGEISSTIAVCAEGSWYKIHFAIAAQASEFRDALFELVNWLYAPEKTSVAILDRRAARGLIEDLTGAPK